MASRRCLLIGLLVFFALSTFVSAQTIRERAKRDPSFRLYTVIFGITVDQESRLQTFRVAKVTDPRSGTTNAVDVQIPEKYVEAARKKDSASYPHTVITDLDLEPEKQP